MLYRERVPARQAGAELVLLHGWGATSDCWRSALPLLRQHFNVTLIDLPGHGASRDHNADLDAFIDQLMQQMPARAVYLGWSLGGMLATSIAARYPERVAALITVASNASFVEREGWQAAMPLKTFHDFVARFEANPARGLKRFDLLQNAASASQLGNASIQRALLEWLRQMDNRAALRGLQCPALLLFGAEDALVPQACVANVNALNPSLKTRLLAGGGHRLFESSTENFWREVIGFCREHALLSETTEHHLDKRRVAHSFSKAAKSYDSVADLQRRVADTLATRLADVECGVALDLGCGTGYSLPKLSGCAQRVIAMDLAEGMLTYARSLEGRDAQGWVCGDAEDLPLADDSVDQVFSSLAVQWCENIAAVFAEAYRVMRPGGEMLVSTLGPDTLFELREAGRAADNSTHVNRFLARDELERGIALSGLTLVAWQEAQEILEYQHLRELMGELKNLGAHNVNSDRAGGLMGKQALRRFMTAYESYRNERGLLPASYQVWYLHLKKKSDSNG